MSKLTRQFVAVLMLLWLPLSGAGALAATISMQAQQGSCHQAAMQLDDMDMHHHDAMPDVSDHSASHDESNTSCNDCGVCHLACSGYLAVPGLAAMDMPQAVAATTPYTVSFHSVTSIPLLPPPLVRA